MVFHCLLLLGYSNLEIMPQIKHILLGTILMSFISACVDPFSPNLGSQSTPKYVVFGQVTDQAGYQTVSVSMSSTLANPKYKPLIGCTVKIIDNYGNVFNMVEFEKGTYQVWMDNLYLIPGNSYQVNVLTPTGIEIVSDFDQMQECPEIDSVYYIRKDIPTTSPSKPMQGIQFYIDIDAKNTNSHFFRWDIDETWEHHANYPKVWYWNMKQITRVVLPDYSKFYCWTTLKLPNIYTLSTNDLTQNKYTRFQLHFVDNLTQRLTYCYSLLINQIALSEPAYNYWDKLRINSNEQGGLYEMQPLRIKGNLKSTTHPELEILGFFGASSMKTKRIFVRDVKNLALYYPPCESRVIETGDLNKEEPRYLLDVPGAGLQLIEDACVECNYWGGSFVKPVYWPY